MSDRVSEHMQCAEFCMPAVAEVDVVCTVSIDVYNYVKNKGCLQCMKSSNDMPVEHAQTCSSWRGTQ